LIKPGLFGIASHLLRVRKLWGDLPNSNRLIQLPAATCAHAWISLTPGVI